VASASSLFYSFTIIFHQLHSFDGSTKLGVDNHINYGHVPPTFDNHKRAFHM